MENNKELENILTKMELKEQEVFQNNHLNINYFLII